MAKTGIHIKRCNVGSVEAHNKRTKGYIEGLKKAGVNIYFFQELSHNNRSWVNPRYKGKTCEQLFKDMIEEYKALHKKHQAPALKDVKRINKKTGKEYTVAGWSPIREGVVPIKEDTQLSDFKPVEEWARGKGLDVVRIDMHHDEGYKDEETGNIKFNRHAHIVFDWLDHQTGKTLKLNEQDMRELQDVVADALQMERGESKAKTGAEHRDVEQQRIHADQERIKEAEKKMQEMKTSLLDLANSVFNPNYYNQDDYKEMSLEEVVESWKEDIEDTEKEILDTEQKLSWTTESLENQKKELRKTYSNTSDVENKLKETVLDLSKAQKELSTINNTLEGQKRLISQKNDQLEKANEGIALAKSFDHRISQAFQLKEGEDSLWGVSRYKAVVEECEKFKSELVAKYQRIESVINKAVDCVSNCIQDMRRRAFTDQEVSLIDTALGKNRRQERAEYMLKVAEEDAGVRHGNYAGCAIWERDLKAIARGESVRTEISRGRGYGY